MKRILPLLLAVLLMCGCAAAPVEETTVATTTAPTVQTEPSTEAVVDGELIGICLPDEKDRRWANEAADMEMVLTELGYRVETLYAGGDAARQAQQIQTLIEKDARCLIVAAVDSAELWDVCETAKKAHIPVVSYDRLLMDTEAVCAHVGFDYRQIGRDMAGYILDTKVPTPEESYTIELFMGSPEDPNALQLYMGLMEQLQPYFDNGALVSHTGRTAFEDCCIVGWNGREAGGRLARYLAYEYKEKMPDILCMASDTMAISCIDVLAGQEVSAEETPFITGVGGELVDGQVVTFGTNFRALAEPAAMIAHQLITAQDLTVTDTEGCHNNAVTVPAYFAETEMILP